ncbi:MAG: methylamine utilization protein [Pseudomonadota bacterium]|nr:methylamine utilization protein [Pseudomonadota bacterium]
MRNFRSRVLLSWIGAVTVAGGLGCSSTWAAVVEVQVVGTDGKPLTEAVVFLESPAAQAAAKPVVNVQVEQAKRQFTQRVSIVTVGSEVRFPNHDTVRHQVYSFSPIKTFELRLYAGTPSNPVLFDKPGIAVLGCNIHDSMVAWIVVVETPYFGMTNAQGTVRLEGVPAGNFHLRTWHPGLAPGAPVLDQALAVPAAGSKLSVKLPLVAASV